MVTIKGREYSVPTVKDSHARRAQQYKNTILERLRKLGLTEDDVEIPHEPLAFRKVAASVLWWFRGHHQYYSYGRCSNYAENLCVVSRVLDVEITALLTAQQTADEFIEKFREDTNIEQARKDAREVLGLAEDTVDLTLINRTYKDLAKRHHPDTVDGDTEKFQKINAAHKTLKRELE
jgi:hypothetical protein